jgi:hypothetical protein
MARRKSHDFRYGNRNALKLLDRRSGMREHFESDENLTISATGTAARLS